VPELNLGKFDSQRALKYNHWLDGTTRSWYCQNGQLAMNCLPPYIYRIFVKIVRSPAFYIRCIYALCLSGATYNHLLIVARYGLNWNYGGLPVFVCIFWTALTFIDPLAAILLMLRPVPGLVLTVAIISSDVAVNSWVGLHYGFDAASFFAQVLFLIFVMSTVRIAWGAVRESLN
jgi:hypothetical protein